MTTESTSETPDGRGLALRACCYCAYVALVWYCAAVCSFFPALDARGETGLKVLAGVSMAGGIAVFAASSFARRFRLGPFSEFALGSFGRTGLYFIAVVIVCLKIRGDHARALALRALVCYFALAPVLLWLTFPRGLSTSVESGVENDHERLRTENDNTSLLGKDAT